LARQAADYLNRRLADETFRKLQSHETCARKGLERRGSE
jgi:hypothetical protein